MPKAVEWLISVYDQLTSLDELLQMSIIEVIRLDCKNDTTHRVSLLYLLGYHPHPHFCRLAAAIYQMHV
jgi:hypothetical protein